MSAPIYPTRVTLCNPGPDGSAVSGFSATVTITRPANTTPYNAGDAIGDTGGSAILTFDPIGPAGGHIIITGAMLELDIAALPAGMTGFRAHLYDDTPGAIADNAAWDLSSAGDRGKYLGYIDIRTPSDLGSTLLAQEDALVTHRKLKASTTSLKVILQTIGGFTPAANSEVYKLTLRAVQA